MLQAGKMEETAHELKNIIYK